MTLGTIIFLFHWERTTEGEEEKKKKRIVDDGQCYVLFNVDLWLCDLVPMY
jgi:hypothetical protein